MFEDEMPCTLGLPVVPNHHKPAAVLLAPRVLWCWTLSPQNNPSERRGPSLLCPCSTGCCPPLMALPHLT